MNSASRLIAIVWVVAAISGCSGPPSATHDPKRAPRVLPSATAAIEAWAAEFDVARKNATSSFERGVLADGVISRVEYEESVHRYVKCMTDAGVGISAIADSMGRYSYESTHYSESASDLCTAGRTAWIEPLYEAIITYPDGPPKN